MRMSCAKATDGGKEAGVPMCEDIYIIAARVKRLVKRMSEER